MSSMTEEEEYYYFRHIDEVDGYKMTVTVIYQDKALELLDWLNAHHFDYRIVPSTGKTLIESGLALKAPMDMYNTSTTTRNAKPRPNRTSSSSTTTPSSSKRNRKSPFTGSETKNSP